MCRIYDEDYKVLFIFTLLYIFSLVVIRLSPFVKLKTCKSNTETPNLNVHKFNTEAQLRYITPMNDNASQHLGGCQSAHQI